MKVVETGSRCRLDVQFAAAIYLAVAVWLGAVSATAQSSRPGMGAIPYADAGGTGVTFRVWSPNATSVAVRGSFNG